MKSKFFHLINEISALPTDWHGSGTVNLDVLFAIARHCECIGPIYHSAETGSGRTTLLFSQLSDNHLVFAKDLHGSIAAVKASSLFNPEPVTFVEGPTQITLPGYKFQSNLQIVLLDGPHGYPFPDLEYYYFYPVLESGGLLLLDDTRIPSIARMLDILMADDMFELLEVVCDTAFLRRSDAPTINPLGDCWWEQGYNRSYFESIKNTWMLKS